MLFYNVFNLNHEEYSKITLTKYYESTYRKFAETFVSDNKI